MVLVFLGECSMQQRNKNKKVKCPNCQYPHSFTEVIFIAENDTGVWEIECNQCDNIFFLKVANPDESYFHPNYLIKDRHSNIEGCEFANDIIEYNIDLNEQNSVFNYSGIPIYLCDENDSNLELKAKNALEQNLGDIKKQYVAAINYCLGNRTPNYEFVVIKLKIDCDCMREHIATYYCKFLLNGTIQESLDEYLLADITSTNLEDNIDGLFSKNEIMTMLEKLIIRWNLFKDKIFIAAPFVGHQWLKKGDKLSTWKWLLSRLDHKKTIFLTRKATHTSYKNLLKDVDGLDHGFLEQYNLENKIISAEVTKQDFHAKFFIGMSEGISEVMSGSANLVTGPSIENINFKRLSRKKIESKYMNKLKIDVPKVSSVNRHWIEISYLDGKWQARSREGAIQI